MWTAKLILFFGLQFSISQVLSQELCNTPDGSRGTCINIKRCDPLVTLLYSQTEESKTFLRKSFCGYQGKEVHVCCPATIDDRTTPRTTRNPTQNLPELLTPPHCGYSNSSNKRVVGGQDAKLGDWPWIAVLGYRSKNGSPAPRWLCGGSLISSRHVLTAAHCIYERNDLFVVRLGDLNLDDAVYDKADPQTVSIEKSIAHPEYESNTYANDIGIIKLKWDVEFNDKVKPICLPTTQEVRSVISVGKKAVVAGWGSTSFEGPASKILQEVEVPIVSQSSCKSAYGTFGSTVVDDRIICAGYATGGKDACRGDSGGPLMLPVEFSYYAIGVVSYGWKCAEPGFPGVYSRTDKFLDFIRNNLN